MKANVKLAIILIIFLIAVSAGYFFTFNKPAGQKVNGSDVSAQEVKRAVEAKDDVIIVDVRTPEEYEAGHLMDSLLLPLDTIGSKASRVIPDKDKKIYVYCRSGNRSARAVSQLQDLGYKDVHSMDGGMISWQNSGFESCTKESC